MLTEDPACDNPVGREIEEAITVLKKGAYLLKLGRRGRLKLCHFRVTDDESVLLWSYKNKMKQLILRDVFEIKFQKSTGDSQHEAEGRKSFYLFYKNKSLDLVCKDRQEASVWFIGLVELITFRDDRKRIRDSVSTSVHSQASGLDDMKVSAGASLASDVSSSGQGFAQDNGEASGKDEKSVHSQASGLDNMMKVSAGASLSSDVGSSSQGFAHDNGEASGKDENYASDNPVEREIEEAIIVLKKGAYLLKHGRRGRLKLCHFRLTDDESVLLWSYKNKMKQLVIRDVYNIEYRKSTVYWSERQSFSVVEYKGKSLDLVCKDRQEASVWFVGLLELITFGEDRKRMRDSVSTSVHSQASGLDDMKVSAPASLASDVGSSSQGFAHDYGEAYEKYANLVGNILNFVGSPTPKAQLCELKRRSNPPKEEIAIAGKESGKCKVD